MVKSSPHTQWKKGCPLCSMHKGNRNGDTVRTPWAVLRQFGVKRRYSRNRLTREQRDE